MARSLHNQGDAQKDVLQGFVPGRYIGFLTCREVGHTWQYDPFSSVVLIDYSGW